MVVDFELEISTKVLRTGGKRVSEESKFIKALKHNSIRTKLLIIMILISAIPIFILGVTSIFEFTQNSNLNFEQNGISLGESVEKHVDSKFKAVEDIANYIIEKHKYDKSNLVEMNLNGKDYKVSFTTSDTTEWKVLVEVPKKELNKSVNEYKIILTPISIILLIINVKTRLMSIPTEIEIMHLFLVLGIY